MIPLSRVAKLIHKLNELCDTLETTRHIAVHRDINQFYFMQKSEELRILHDQLKALDEKREAMQHLAEIIYREAAGRWKHDLKLLATYTTRPIHDRSM